MKWVSKVQTSDGTLHDNAQKAQHHAEVRYGEALTQLAHKLVRCEKYTQMCEFLDANLDAFLQLKALKDDTVLEKGEDEEPKLQPDGPRR